MKKDKPAKKGFSPFKENSSTHKKKSPAGAGGRIAASRKKDDKGGDFKHSEKKSFRKRDDDSSDFRHSDKKPFRKRDESSDFKRDDKKTFRKRDEGGDYKQSDKKSFRKRDSDSSDFKRGDKKPFSKRDDSSFHGDFKPASRDKRSSRETPSGFNRQKFFDRTNERFSDKQSRKTSYKKYRDEESPAADSEGMPLNKYIAHCGICSRRKAVDFIKEGKVTVNGQLIEEPAFKVTAKDVVKLSDKRITLQKDLVYILLNKPKGFITTTDDPEGRQTVMELISNATEDRVFPVGRLDRNTSGLLLLTNDGELAQKLAHPKHNIKKIYQVELDKPLTKADYEQILQGVTLEDGIALVDALGYVDAKDKKQIGIEIHSGKNRIVRRIFEHLEYRVEKLDRVMYAGLTKKNLNRGKWRFLSEKEIILLKHFK
jgi:23S rRNA pseudouridine2605 synthase